MVTVVLISACASTILAETSETTITVASYNIHVGVPMGKQIGLDKSSTAELDDISATIAEARADIVALQEVDCEYGLSLPERRRSSLINQSRYLAAASGCHYIFGSAQDDTGYPTDNAAYVEWGTADQWINNGMVHGEVGNALLSRWSFTASPSNIPLPMDEGQERRACVRAELAVPVADDKTSVPIVVYATHLQHDNGKTRYKQMEAILDRATAEADSTLVFIIGDLNHEFSGDLNHEFSEDESQNPIRLALGRGFHDLAAPGGDSEKVKLATFPADRPDTRIDYILSNQPLQVLDKRVIYSQASDHLPVAVTVVLESVRK